MLTTASLDGPLRTQIDYSYLSERLAGPGFFLVGDAGGFIDPLLSSGVHLALCSAVAASATVASVLARELDEETGAAFYQQAYRGNFLRWVLLVSALYQANGAKDSLFWAAQELSTRDLAKFYGQEPNVVLSTAVSGVPDVKALQSSSLMQDHLRTGLLAYRSGLLSEFVEHASGRGRGMHMLQNFDSAGLRSDHPVGGLYVSLSPSLGLRRAPLVESGDLQGAKPSSAVCCSGPEGQAP
jgi:hypothetical protein